MREEFRPAIEALQKDLADLERKVMETKTTINRLAELGGGQPLYADVGTASQPSITAIRGDTFYGKVLTTAAREYLEMRRAANLGPATPRDIYAALVQGGFKFDTTVEANALTTVRGTMRKNSSIFHKLPNGEYGLLAWYPRAKAAKPSASSPDDEDSPETEASATEESPDADAA